jgi:hypothetical protein
MYVIYLYNKQVLDGWWSFAVEGFWALLDYIYECVCCNNRSHGNKVKEFWAFWDNIYDYVFTAPDFSIIFTGNLLVFSIY